MSETRLVSGSFWSDTRIGLLTPMARLMFLGMLSLAEPATGVFRAKYGAIRGALFSEDDFTNAKVAGWFEEILAKSVDGRAMVATWHERGEDYGVFVAWHRHQKFKYVPAPKLPYPPPELVEKFGLCRLTIGPKPVLLRTPFAPDCPQIGVESGPTFPPNFPEKEKEKEKEKKTQDMPPTSGGAPASPVPPAPDPAKIKPKKPPADPNKPPAPHVALAEWIVEEVRKRDPESADPPPDEPDWSMAAKILRSQTDRKGLRPDSKPIRDWAQEMRDMLTWAWDVSGDDYWRQIRRARDLASQVVRLHPRWREAVGAPPLGSAAGTGKSTSEVTGGQWHQAGGQKPGRWPGIPQGDLTLIKGRMHDEWRAAVDAQVPMTCEEDQGGGRTATVATSAAQRAAAYPSAILKAAKRWGFVGTPPDPKVPGDLPWGWDVGKAGRR